MNDVVWVSLISAGGAVVAALTAQFLAMKAAARQAARTEQQEALQWQRSEAKRMQECQDARLREFWSLVLLSQSRIADCIPSPAGVIREIPIADSAVGAAAQAYAVALIGLPGVRQLAKEFYLATARVHAMLEVGEIKNPDHVVAWKVCFESLEAAVILEADVTAMAE